MPIYKGNNAPNPLIRIRRFMTLPEKISLPPERPFTDWINVGRGRTLLENKPTITRFGGNEKSIRPKCEGREHVYPTRPIRIGAENAAALRRNVSFFGASKKELAFRGTFYVAWFLLNELNFCFFGSANASPKKQKSRSFKRNLAAKKVPWKARSPFSVTINPVLAAMSSKNNHYVW